MHEVLLMAFSLKTNCPLQGTDNLKIYVPWDVVNQTSCDVWKGTSQYQHNFKYNHVSKLKCDVWEKI